MGEWMNQYGEFIYLDNLAFDELDTIIELQLRSLGRIFISGNDS